ncbi:IclR family transcriptional regulator [Novosphingobium bradum]|uniref:IclR family transcriptional regulator n=1 Tax=Novosphingobium bradum TaxID=1737444 RepID=A0ABV7IM62_9SPHN
MTRPALSALRALEIIDFLSQAPSHAYTLSELVRHTGTNVASLHAVLAVLMRRGYLVRHPVHKTYRLSPALAALGEAVAANDPILGHARNAARNLAERTGLEVTVTARAGEDAVCLARAAGATAPRTSMSVGQRLTLRPPLGTLYYAWSEPDEVEDWIARGDWSDAARARAALDLVRSRGFLVTVGSSLHDALAEQRDDHQPRARSNENLARLLKGLERAVYQPERIEPGESHAVDLISAPIFDHTRQATYAMNLTGFAQDLTGEDILRHARLLTEECDGVMRDSGVHGAPRR